MKSLLPEFGVMSNSWRFVIIARPGHTKGSDILRHPPGLSAFRIGQVIAGINTQNF